MSNINSVELKALEIPLPPLAVQQDLAQAMRDAWDRRTASVDAARAILSETGNEVLNALGVPPLSLQPEQLWWSVPLTLLIVGGRLDPQATNPSRLSAINRLRTGDGSYTSTKLRDLVEPVRLQASESGLRNYIGLADVEQQTGELINHEPAVAPSAGSLLFNEGDILYARLRPKLNKVTVAPFSGACSPEFLVLRPKDGGSANSQFISLVLRTSVVVSQTVSLVSGNTLPRISASDMLDVLVPVPSSSLQWSIVRHVEGMREEARELRSRGASIWSDAKRRFEEHVLGPPLEEVTSVGR